MRRDISILTEDQILDEDEIAILVKDDSILSLTSSLDRMLEAYGFEPCRFVEANYSGIQIYKDRDGNMLTVDYEIVAIGKRYDDCEISIWGILVNPLAEMYMSRLKKVKRIDLRDCIKFYPKNVFFNAIEKLNLILKNTAKRRMRNAECIYI